MGISTNHLSLNLLSIIEYHIHHSGVRHYVCVSGNPPAWVEDETCAGTDRRAYFYDSWRDLFNDV